MFTGYNITMNKPIVYLLSGVSGSGKSWVAEHLKRHIKYVSYDITPKKEALETINASTVPILYDPTTGVSTFIKAHTHEYEIHVYTIVDDFLQIKQRLVNRGGTVTKGLYRRYKRMKSIANTYAEFYGTSTEVFKELKNVLSKQRPYKIYKATSPSGKVYIGKSFLDLSVRIQCHKHDALVRNKPWAFSHAIRKYGDKIKFEIIHDNILSYGEVNFLEKKYIAEYSSGDPEFGYNLTIGGDGGQLLGESYIKKIEAMKVFYASEAGILMKEKLRKSSLDMRKDIGDKINKKVKEARSTPESRLKTSIASKKLYSDPAMREKLSIINKESYKDEALRKRVGMAVRVARAKAFNVWDKDGLLVGSWDNPTTCAEDLKIPRGGIYHVLQNRTKTHKGYTFKYI